MGNFNELQRKWKFQFVKLEKKLLEREFFDVAYQPQINTFNGNTNVEFNLVDIQID